MTLLRQWLDRLKPPTSRSRLAFDTSPAVAYAVGDVHGCLDLLKDLEAKIIADAADIEGEKWLVMLGDYVDRGPRSAAVIDHLLAPPPARFRRLCLAGNHEALMQGFLTDPQGHRDWLEFGGIETLESYGMSVPRDAQPARLSADSRAYIPQAHVRFLAELPALITTPDWIFVHAGLRPGVALSAQTDEDLCWFRDNFAADYREFSRVVVHGHTPLQAPFVSSHRIDVDTGAFARGVLTAVRLVRGEHPVLLATGGPAER